MYVLHPPSLQIMCFRIEILIEDKKIQDRTKLMYADTFPSWKRVGHSDVENLNKCPTPSHKVSVLYSSRQFLGDGRGAGTSRKKRVEHSENRAVCRD